MTRHVVAPGETALALAENAAKVKGDVVRFALKPYKVFLFDRDSESRVKFEVK